MPYRDLIDLTPTTYRYNVVVVVPTLFYPMQDAGRRLMRRLAKRDPAAIRERMEHYLLNEMMARWIVQEGYSRSTATELWYFDDRLMDMMAARIEAICGQYILRHQFYASEVEAQMALNADPGIAGVYDADHDRVDDLWRFRGYRVPLGGSP